MVQFESSRRTSGSTEQVFIGIDLSSSSGVRKAESPRCLLIPARGLPLPLAPCSSDLTWSHRACEPKGLVPVFSRHRKWTRKDPKNCGPARLILHRSSDGRFLSL